MNIRFPKHEAGLTLAHNEHKGYYQSATDWIEDQERLSETGAWFDWVSSEEKEKAIATDSIWTLQWYPRTPNGFHAVAASTVEAVLAGALNDEA